MKSVGSGFFQELLLFSAVVFPDVVVPMSSVKECKEEKTQKGSTVVVRNIGIKMCQVRCSETGGCLRFDFDIDTLTCRLRLGDSNAMEKKKEIKLDQKTHSDVTPGPCSSTSCSLGTRCLESRSGKPVCVKSGKMFNPSRSQQQRTDKNSESGDSLLLEACREGDLHQVQTIISKGQVDIDDREEEYGRTPVMLAARGGYRDVFDLVMSKGGDASLVDSNGDNILHLACYGGNEEMVKYIISQNFADINSRGNYGMTPMMVAAYKRQRKSFDLVMSKGGDASLVDRRGDNILHWACRGGHVEMVKYVISQNLVDINSKGNFGRTSLMVAAVNGHRDVFDLVMSKGGDASIVDSNGDNIQHLACYGGNEEIVKYVISQNFADINSRGKYGMTPMMVAAYKRQRKAFDLVMSKGGDASLVDRRGDNILHWACRGGHEDMVKSIISQNLVDINSKGLFGRTPLMVAAGNGHRYVFDLVMCKGGDASLVDSDGENILHLACYGGNEEMVKYVISQNLADINSRGKYGMTPMMVAAYKRQRKVFDLVMSKGGDASLVDRRGDNILHWACRGGHVEMVKYVISQNFAATNSRGNNGMTPMMVAAANGQRKAFNLVMSKGGDASLVDANGDNILHWACRGHEEMVKSIISQNLVDINSKGHFGRTPLMLAAVNGHRDVFDLVMSKGGDASLVDANGDNILHLACRGHEEMVKSIISQNLVDINSKGHFGRTPLMVAAVNGHRDVFDLVMSKGGDASLVDSNGDNILHLACYGGSEEMVKYVISKNFADINSRGNYGMTPMMVAAANGQRKAFDLVMSKGGDASLVDRRGDNILHWACRGGHVEMVKYVISQNFAEINSRGHNGMTPMMVAAAQGQRKVFDFVMSKGGDASLVDANGDNVLHWACLRGHEEMVKHIISKPIVDVNVKDKDGDTAAMLAKKTTHREIHDLLAPFG